MTSLFIIITELSTTIPVPVFAPVINNHVDSSSSRKLFMVNISNAMPTQGMIEEPHQNISYLYRVESDSNTSYVWQVGSSALAVSLY